MHVIHLVYQLVPDMLLIEGLWQPRALSQLRLQKVLVRRNGVPSGNISVSIPYWTKASAKWKRTYLKSAVITSQGNSQQTWSSIPTLLRMGKLWKLKNRTRRFNFSKRVVSSVMKFSHQLTLAESLKSSTFYDKESIQCKTISRKLAIFISSTNVPYRIVEKLEFHDLLYELNCAENCYCQGSLKGSQ